MESLCSDLAHLPEVEIQALILGEAMRRSRRVLNPTDATTDATGLFSSFVEDWPDCLPALVRRGWFSRSGEGYDLTDVGMEAAAQVLRLRPPIWYWYRRYYVAIQTSQAYAEFCDRVFGANCGQHGFADMQQVDRLLSVTALGPGARGLDIGCGDGRLTECMAAHTGAHVTGIDNVPEAINIAQQRHRLPTIDVEFRLADLNDLSPLPASVFDVLISIDTLYFTDILATVGRLKRLLKPDGELAILYSHGADPETPLPLFDRATLPPQQTPLGRALIAHGVPFASWDLTEEDYAHAVRKKKVLEELRPRFEEEGTRFLFDNRYGEACGVMQAIEEEAGKRYLYLVRLDEGM